MIPQTQGSPEWLEWRKDKIGASDATTIMGENPDCTPFTLWQRKLGLIEEQEQNPAMKRGHSLEPKAREYLEMLMGRTFIPYVDAHAEREWQIASLDAWNPLTREAIEIKCLGAKGHAIALSGEVPKIYMSQLQHQMSVFDLDHVGYLSFDGEEGILLYVKRDDAYIERMLAKELEFIECLRSFTAPPLTNKDYTSMEGDETWKKLTDEWKHCQLMTNFCADLEKKLRNLLIEKTQGKSCYGNSVKISRVVKRGNVAYKDIPQLKDVDLEPYRGKPVEYWRMTEESE